MSSISSTSLAGAARLDAASPASESKPYVVALLGDSWIEGRHRLALPLSKLLLDEMGDAGGGFASFCHGGANPALISVMPKGEWETVDQTPEARGVDIAHRRFGGSAQAGNGGDSFTVKARATRLRIHYASQPGGGSFRYRLDAGEWTAVETSASRPGYAVIRLEELEDVSHQLVIEGDEPGASGVILLGVDAARDTPGARVHKLGNGGLTALQMARVDKTIWQEGLKALEPDSVVLLLGTNDRSSNVPPAEFAHTVREIAGRIRQALPDCGIVLVAPSENGQQGKTYPMALYRDQLWRLSTTLDCDFLDLGAVLGDYGAIQAENLFQDPVHPGKKAGERIAAALLPILLRQKAQKAARTPQPDSGKPNTQS